MFPRNYFPAEYFAPLYFPPVIVIIIPVRTRAGEAYRPTVDASIDFIGDDNEVIELVTIIIAMVDQ